MTGDERIEGAIEAAAWARCCRVLRGFSIKVRFEEEVSERATVALQILECPSESWPVLRASLACASLLTAAVYRGDGGAARVFEAALAAEGGAA